ncbi:Ankyrin repeat and SOCS box 3 [Fusarium albosuccineum]|uniref:Ankyrin repeat and SOCS box 3 n=1 Tax=Fusarium albosuccineum TaxID=1237068 RepID=A0A8H4LHU6_9HYPO|nr:Ankyrin repeat and SOCS box 3 [Fusarium albosuccineum]
MSLPPFSPKDGHSGLVECIVDVLSWPITQLQPFIHVSEQVTLPYNIFPLEDFEADPNRAPFYNPRDGTCLFFSPMHRAAYDGKESELRVLAALHEDVDQLPVGGATTALFLSLIGGHRNIAKWLLDHGADPAAGACVGALHAAASQGYTDLIDRFIHKDGVDPDFQDKDGATPVVYSIRFLDNDSNAMRTISRLFDLGAKPNIMFGNFSSWTYGDLARSMGREGLADWLNRRADPTLNYTSEYALGRQTVPDVESLGYIMVGVQDLDLGS